MIDSQRYGSSVAYDEPVGSTPLSPSASVQDLLELVPKRKGSTCTGPALHSAAALFVSFLGMTSDQVQIKELLTDLEQFSSFLSDRRYTKETVKSYRYCINILVKIARQHGWQTTPEVMPPDWELVLSFTGSRSKAIRSLVGWAVRIGKKPSTLSEDDLMIWCQTRVATGTKLGTAQHSCSSFRALMGKPQLAHLKPLVKPASNRYGRKLEHMHPSLRKEIEQLEAFWTAPFNPNRDGKALRRPTVRKLVNIFVAMVGYQENVCHQEPVESITSLVTRENIVEYATWAITERNIAEQSLRTSLGTLRSGLQNNPRYKDMDLKWVKGTIKQLQPRERSDIDRRKQKKLILYSAAESIPSGVRSARENVKGATSKELAISHRDELLMLWLIILPWRQRSLRECRLTGGSHPNLYRAPVASLSTATQPDWLAQQEKANPGLPVWQIQFAQSETKGKHQVIGYLPRELAAKLQEYLEHRDALIPVGHPDPGTLFLTSRGGAMTQLYIGHLVKELSSRHASRAVNPHLFRDIVAYEWLSKNPADYVTLSKLLWHSNLEYTLKVYGSRFDESTGLARMDNWRSNR